ncbi:MAG: helix-turn-helix domain-containing protein [Vulcanimicrobiaceae bacterium]|jgi:excisionase family DNA binding protein
MNAAESGGDRLITVSEVCGRLGLGRTKVSELLLRGAIASAKIDGRRLVSSASLDQFIQAALAADAALRAP